MSEHDHERGCKCCPGPMGHMGPKGAMGPQGLQGIQGVAGLNGLDGLDGKNGKDGQDGAQGLMGLQGVPGEQGPQGVPGDCVECRSECHCDKPEYAQVYSIATQTLPASPGADLAGGVVLFEKLMVSTANIDVSQAGINGKIFINKSGYYDVTTIISGGLNPIPSPLPVWTVSLFKNGTLVPGSTFANLTLSPEQKINELSSDTFMHFMAGDFLELANTSVNVLFVGAAALGTNVQTNSASLKVNLLKAD